MRDEDKPFVCYQQGWNMKIVPRNAAGWRALGLWMLALMLPTLAMIPLSVHFDDTPQEYLVTWAIAPLLLTMAVTTIFMIRWMKVRSEVIDIDGLIEIKRQQDIVRKKRGR